MIFDKSYIYDTIVKIIKIVIIILVFIFIITSSF
jgi:hypothetical protein